MKKEELLKIFEGGILCSSWGCASPHRHMLALFELGCLKIAMWLWQHRWWLRLATGVYTWQAEWVSTRVGACLPLLAVWHMTQMYHDYVKPLSRSLDEGAVHQLWRGYCSPEAAIVAVATCTTMAKLHFYTSSRGSRMWCLHTLGSAAPDAAA